MKTSTVLSILAGIGSVTVAGLSAVGALVTKKENDAEQTEKIDKAVAEALLARQALESRSEL